MTSKRNLGPVLAIAGAVIAVVAVIAGFILIGGPGDARGRRLDEMTMNRITGAISTVQCAYNATGFVPTSIDAARKTPALPVTPNQPSSLCGERAADSNVKAGDRPSAPGEVTYSVGDGARIRLCGHFRRPKAQGDPSGYYNSTLWVAYPQLNEPRQSGVHCFDLEMVKGIELTRLPASHAGHMDVFE